MPSLVLRVVGARAGGIIRQELPKFVLGEHETVGRGFGKVHVTHSELGIRAIRALRIAVDELAEVVTCVNPLPVLEGRHAAFIEKLVGACGSRRKDVLLGPAPRDEYQSDEECVVQSNIATTTTFIHHAVADTDWCHWHCLRRPSSNVTDGLNPRSR